MVEEAIYKTYLYIAGIRVPLVSCSVASQFGQISSFNIELNYSPYINHIHEYTKIQLWEQKIADGKVYPEELQFDGVVIGVVRNKNVIGNVSARLTCLSDGVIWNQRKQYDFYLNDIADVDIRLTGDVRNMRADGAITNYFGSTVSSNLFDIGCSVASVLTSTPNITLSGESENNVNETSVVSYDYIYNGKKYYKQVLETKEKTANGNPLYYNRFLDNYKLAFKLYGVSTYKSIKDFFQYDRTLKLIGNNVQDLVGENTFWGVAAQIMQYGFYSVYDIPNPTYIKSNKKVAETFNTTNSVNLSDVKDPKEDYTSKVSITGPEPIQFNGLAQYILKPISVLGVPLKCNIIFPNQVVSESLFLDYLNIPTRVLYQKNPIPNSDNSNILLTTIKIAGPIIPKTNENYFASFTPEVLSSSPKINQELSNDIGAFVRTGSIYSEYEKEYGIRYQQLQFSYAFDAALLGKELSESETEEQKQNVLKNANKKINNFLNYEFAQRFFASRNYNIQVTPDVDIVVGLPVIILNQNQEHIIAFCVGKQKSWDARGNKTVMVSLSYPRYYYEDIDDLGNAIDPTSYDDNALKELEILFGSKRFVDGQTRITSALLKTKIDELFNNYIANKGNIDYNNYKRKVCNLSEFIELHTGKSKKYNSMPDEYLENTFESTEQANNLSSHTFYVNGEKQPLMSNKTIIKKHLEWISKGQRI